MKALALRILRGLLTPILYILGGTAILFGMSLPSQSDLGFSSEAEVTEPTSSLLNPTPLDRLAVVALFRTGFLRQVPVLPSDPETGEPVATDEPAPSAFQSDRRGWGVSGYTDSCTETELARAILAAEGYARPAWRRSLESSTASLIQGVTGTLPDWSYGLGQIRLSTAQTSLERLQSEAERILQRDLDLTTDPLALFHALQDRCQNSLMVEILLTQIAEIDQTPQEVAALYRGGRSWPTLPSVVSYERLVAHIATAVLPSVRQSGGEYGVSISGGYDEPLGYISPIDRPDRDLQPLACLLGSKTVAFASADLLPTELKNLMDGEFGIAPDLSDDAFLRAARSLPNGPITLLPPEHFDPLIADELLEGTTLGSEWYRALAAANLLRTLRPFGDGPVTIASGIAQPVLRSLNPDCQGWLILAPSANAWDSALAPELPALP